jgi:hypothetical protein
MRLTRSRAALLVGLVALAGSITGLRDGFPYDDTYIVEHNRQVHTLAHPARFFTDPYWPPLYRGGNTLYRPLTSIGFAGQWVAGAGTPLTFHLVSVALYLLASLAVLGLAAELLPLGPATMAAILFAAHPVHVEAVAGVVGQSELWVGLFAAAGAWAYVRGRNAIGLIPSARYTIYGCYAGACLAKENGVMLLGLLVGAELLLSPAPGNWRVRLASLRETWAILLGIAATFLLARTTVIGSFAGDWPNRLIAHADLPQRFLTMLPVVTQWLRLLLWPARLQIDYGPRELMPADGFGPAQALGLLLLGTLVGVTAWAWRRRPVIAFGLLWTGIALFPVSNLLLKSGVVLAERTLFLPSIGAMLALAAGAAMLGEGHPQVSRVLVLGGLAAIGLGVTRSALRQRDWKNDILLFTRMTLDAPGNYRGHALLGRHLFAQGHRQEGIQQMLIALDLYADDDAIWSDTADLYRRMGRCDKAMPLYRRAIALDHAQPNVRGSMASCLMRLGRFAAARQELQSLTADGYIQFQFMLPAVDSAEHAAHPPR